MVHIHLGDCIDIFEEHGTDPNNHQPVKEPTDRKQLLLKWLGGNEPPPG